MQIKEKPLISEKQSEGLIYDMVRYSDHNHHNLRNLSKGNIIKFFEHNKEPWKRLVSNVRSPRNLIPFVENLAGYEWEFIDSNENSTVSVHQHGHETAKLTGSGQISLLDYHTKFKAALDSRATTIKNGSYSDLLHFVADGVASIESFISGKANIWNKNGNKPKFDIDQASNLDEKLDDWLYRMTGKKLDKSNTTWNYFMDFRNLNNRGYKHNAAGSHAVSYAEIVVTLNKFRKGIAKMLFLLNQYFNDLIPSKIIRAVYLPDCF